MSRTIKVTLMAIIAMALLLCGLKIAWLSANGETVREEWNGALAVEGVDYIIRDGIYEIYTSLGLAYVAYKTNEGTNWSSGKEFKLMDDIDIGEKDWIPIGFKKEPEIQFKGNFDFNGHRVLNLTRTLSYNVSSDGISWFGLFGVVTGRIINPNVTVSDVKITSNTSLYLGGLAGQSNGKIGSMAGDTDITVIIKGKYEGVTSNGQIRMGAIVGQIMGEGTVLGANSNGDVNIKAVIEEDAVLSGKGTQHIFVGGIVGFDAFGTTGSCGDGSVNIAAEIYGKLMGETSTNNPINIGGIVGRNENAVIGNSYNGVSGDVKISVLIGKKGLIYAKTTNPNSLVRMGGIYGQADNNTIGISSENNSANVKFLVTCLSEGQNTGFYVDGGSVASSAIGGMGGVSQGQTTRIGTQGSGKAGFAVIVYSSQFTVVNTSIAWIGAFVGNNAQGAKFGGDSLNSGRAFARAFSDESLKLTGFNDLNFIQVENRVKVIFDNNFANGKLVLEEITFDDDMNSAASEVGFSARAENGYYISGFKQNGTLLDKEFKKGEVYAYVNFLHLSNTVWDIEPVFTQITIPNSVSKEYTGYALSPFDSNETITYRHSRQFINVGEYEVSDVTVMINGGVVGTVQGVSGVYFTITKRISTTPPGTEVIMIDYFNEKIVFDESLVEASSDENYVHKYSSGDSVIMGSLYFRYKETQNTTQSQSSMITLSRPVVEAEVALVTSKSIIMVQVDGAEYRLGDSQYQSSPSFTGLTKNTQYTIYVRIAPTQYSFASEEVSFEVKTLNSYIVSFVTDGGSEIPDMEIDEGNGIQASPATIKPGYEFLGWFDNAQMEGEAVVFPYTPASDVTLYAKWRKIEYIIISFEANGGSNLDDIVAEKDKPVQSLPTPQRPYYTFDGWYVNADFSGKPVTFPAIFSNNTVLYAKWNAVKYVVTVNIGEGAQVEFKSGTDKVEHGGVAEFKIIAESNYDISSIVVKVGNKTLTADSQGYYKIENVTQPVTVTVTGIIQVQPTPAPTPTQEETAKGCKTTTVGMATVAVLFLSISLAVIRRKEV